MDKVKLSKTLSYILRHNPEDFDLQLNPDGTVSTDRLLTALRNQQFPDLTYGHLEQVVAEDEKGRFSLLQEGNQIRANYGHSIEGVHPDYEPVVPPEVLYHGAPRRVKDSILAEGLKPMNRNFVHLSSTKEEAEQVGKRRDQQPVILAVEAEKLHAQGQELYRTGKGIYLTKEIAPQYIRG